MAYKNSKNSSWGKTSVPYTFCLSSMAELLDSYLFTYNATYGHMKFASFMLYKTCECVCVSSYSRITLRSSNTPCPTRPNIQYTHRHEHTERIGSLLCWLRFTMIYVCGSWIYQCECAVNNLTLYSHRKLYILSDSYILSLHKMCCARPRATSHNFHMNIYGII